MSREIEKVKELADAVERVVKRIRVSVSRDEFGNPDGPHAQAHADEADRLEAAHLSMRAMGAELTILRSILEDAVTRANNAGRIAREVTDDSLAALRAVGVDAGEGKPHA